jgi:two-component system, LytTR family, response regulator LytT
MRVVIIEDEMFAARRLENMIREYNHVIDVCATLESVKDSIAWFRTNKEPDLIFLDIHLEDDLSFAIFREVSISCPIVFTTATDEIATRAFKLKKIDFLLKPIMQNDLNAMIDMYVRQTKLPVPIDPDIFNDIVNNR